MSSVLQANCEEAQVSNCMHGSNPNIISLSLYVSCLFVFQKTQIVLFVTLIYFFKISHRNVHSNLLGGCQLYTSLGLTIAFVDYKPGVQTNTSLPACDWPVGQLKFAVGLIDSLCKCTSFGALGQWAES